MELFDDLPADGLPSVTKPMSLSAKKRKIERMQRDRKKMKPCIVYPDDVRKNYWDLFMTFVLLITCLITPWHISFAD